MGLGTKGWFGRAAATFGLDALIRRAGMTDGRPFPSFPLMVYSGPTAGARGQWPRALGRAGPCG
ncbi:hypothetical protein FBZ90_10884 [Nitrospirillum pindoramense]|uniref:Uncharacterized protein n=1 Tax=Nitrospirillum amazonense TaxID=28077 RepID=A0A560H662_9PROT|nr:hypothetical protein FBZ90_10884 [Nitrospirillum amazonense]